MPEACHSPSPGSFAACPNDFSLLGREQRAGSLHGECCCVANRTQATWCHAMRPCASFDVWRLLVRQAASEGRIFIHLPTFICTVSHPDHFRAHFWDSASALMSKPGCLAILALACLFGCPSKGSAVSANDAPPLQILYVSQQPLAADSESRQVLQGHTGPCTSSTERGLSEG